MSDTAIVIGVGELGGLFAQGLLRAGHSVVPIRRGDDLAKTAQRVPSPSVVLVAVGEDDLAPVLSALPAAWRPHVALLQNELVPPHWQQHDIPDPTVCVVWFEKKRGKPVTELLPSAVFGRNAQLLQSALHNVGIHCTQLTDRAALITALVEKNVYIWTTNLAGIQTGGDVGTLLSTHRDFALRVFDEVLELQQALTGQPLDRATLLAALDRAGEADPTHACTGRSAPRRLQRALAAAAGASLELPVLRGLQG
jgi:ketopantoate reductase